MRIAVCRGLILLVLIAGCNSEPALRSEPVSGRITFRGSPLKEGTIEFASQGEQKKRILRATAVKEGKYQLEQGLPAGKYRVSITNTPLGPTAPPETPGQAKQELPPQFNTKSQLTAMVKEGEKNVINFDLK